jgi:5,10-methylenetetrahydromethanopterin reductase
VVEFWLGTFVRPGHIVSLAEMVERDGWDGLALTDSQSLGGDLFGALTLAAHVTDRITLASGATNPATRHPAVIASAMATVQVESHGRAWLGIARGDSAMAYIGRPPMPLGDFFQALGDIQALLSSRSTRFGETEATLQWLAASGRELPKVPMSVAATGPKVIRQAAKVADAITFSVGAEAERLIPAIAAARAARAETDLPPLRLGAYVNAVAHPDIAVAREQVRGRMGVYARFSTMDRRVLETLPAADRAVAEELVRTYDMHAHAATGARHEAALADDFVDRFGIVGPSDRVAERLISLAALGLDHFVIVGHSRNTPAEVFADASRRFCHEVIPAVRHAVP